MSEEDLRKIIKQEIVDILMKMITKQEQIDEKKENLPDDWYEKIMLGKK